MQERKWITIAFRHSKAGGFTLIETLVAISILAIALVVILQLFSGGLRAGRLSEDYSRGIFYAKAKMEEMLLGENLIPGSQEGEFDEQYRWRSEITRVERPEEETVRFPFDSFAIQVEVIWGKGDHQKRFEIRTLKIGEKLETAG